MRLSPRIATLILAAISWTLVVLFHQQDLRLPDGDAMGHLGAIELNLLVLEDRGLEECLRQAFTSGGEYPPLFALLAAFLLFPFQSGPFPEGLPIVLGGIWALTLVGTALFANERSRQGKIGHPLPWAGFLAALILSLSPLALALFRHPMPEPTVALFLVYMAWALERSKGFKLSLPSILAGLFAAAGLLSKQTFAIYALPLGVGAIVQGVFQHRSLSNMLKNLSLFSLFAFPLPIFWLMGNLEAQSDYLQQSAATPSTASLGEHFLYYPFVLLGQGLGIGGIILLIGAVVAAVLIKARGGIARWGWLGSLTILMWIPKKYPRLILPILPLFATDLALSITAGHSKKKGVWRLFVVVGLLAMGAQALDLTLPTSSSAKSKQGVWLPELVTELDPHCFQNWIRPPHLYDPGLVQFHDRLKTALGAIERGLEPPAGQGRILLAESIPITCDYQTTFSLERHVENYIRRRGIDPGFTIVASEEKDAALALFEGGWMTLFVSPRPWDCSPPEIPRIGESNVILPIERAFCPWRTQFQLKGSISSEDPELPYILYVYEKKKELR